MKVIFTILFIIIPLLSYPDEYSGFIYDKNNNEPLIGVTVNVKNTKIETITDQDGYYSICLDLDLIGDTLLYSLIGYYNFELPIKNKQNNIFLTPKEFNLERIYVQAPRFGKIKNYSAQTMTLKSSEVYTSTTAFGDVLGISKILPGVQSPGNDGKYYIRGGDADELKVYVDDLILYNPYQLSQKNISTRSRLSTNMYDATNILYGGYNSEYGQALSGIMKINTLTDMKSNITTNISTTGLGTLFSDALNKFQSEINYTNMFPYGSIFPDKYRWNKYYENVNGNLIKIIDISNNLRIKALFQVDNSTVDYNYLNSDSINIHNKFKETYIWGQLSASYKINEWYISIASNIQYNKFKGIGALIDRDSVSTNTTFNHNKITINKSTEKIDYNIGIEIINTKFDQYYQYIEFYKPFLKKTLYANSQNISLWLFESLNVNIGLRSEYSNSFGKFYLSPRSYIGYKKNNNILSLSYGKYYQESNIDFLKIDENIKMMNVNNLSISYAFIKEKEKFQLDIFYKKYKDLITYTNTIPYYQNIKNNGNGYTFGVDLLWKKNINMLEYWLSYSFIRSRKKEKMYGSSRIPDNIANHTFKCDLKYWAKSARSLLGISYLIDSGSYNNILIDNNMTSKKTPHRDNITFSISYLPTSNVIIHLNCQNILGKKNIYSYNNSIYTGNLYENKTPADRFYYAAIYYKFK